MTTEQKPEVTSVCELLENNDGDALRSFSKTSVLFVSISFIVLMVGGVDLFGMIAR